MQLLETDARHVAASEKGGRYTAVNPREEISKWSTPLEKGDDVEFLP